MDPTWIESQLLCHKLIRKTRVAISGARVVPRRPNASARLKAVIERQRSRQALKKRQKTAWIVARYEVFLPTLNLEQGPVLTKP
jgi:hypothetical protein